MGQNFLNKPFPVSFLWTETHLQLDLDSEEICSRREKETSKYGVMIFLFKELTVQIFFFAWFGQSVEFALDYVNKFNF